MPALQIPLSDLEQGTTRHQEEERESPPFSDLAHDDDGDDDDDDDSCCSQFYSIADGYDEVPEDGVGSRRASSAAQSELSVEIGNVGREIKVVVEWGERDCRICHMGLESGSHENGVGIELGCSCKDDLAAAHTNCAEAWFKIKGNKTCEICNSIASNVIGPNNLEIVQQTSELPSAVSSYVAQQVTSTSETRRCLNGHRFVNFLLACMVFAFVISWLFHFNIPS